MLKNEYHTTKTQCITQYCCIISQYCSNFRRASNSTVHTASSGNAPVKCERISTQNCSRRFLRTYVKQSNILNRSTVNSFTLPSFMWWLRPRYQRFFLCVLYIINNCRDISGWHCINLKHTFMKHVHRIRITSFINIIYGRMYDTYMKYMFHIRFFIAISIEIKFDKKIYIMNIYRCLSGKLWYLQHNCVRDTIVYN